MLDLTKVKLRAKTTYAARKTETPLLSCSIGRILLNTAFMDNFYPKRPKNLYAQICNNREKQYLLLSSGIKPLDYYKVFGAAPSNFKNGGIIMAKGFRTLLNKGDKMTRYKVTEEQTNVKHIKAFLLTEYVSDVVISEYK